MFQGQYLRLQKLADGFAELCFDRVSDAVNRLDAATIAELRRALTLLQNESMLKGLLVCSAKQDFMLGATAEERAALLRHSQDEVLRISMAQSAVITALSDLPMPIVVAVDGFALSAGFELALAADARVMTTSARVGLPEVSLGLIPGLGGTLRLPRLIGLQAAAAWILDGAPRAAEAMQACAAAEQLCAKAELSQTALGQLAALAASGAWRQRRERAQAALSPLAPELAAQWRQKLVRSAEHFPAALAALELMQAAAALDRDSALQQEAQTLASLATTPAARSLMQLARNEQLLKTKANEAARRSKQVRAAAVLGAGIMGGGIAYTSALSGVAVRMKDIAQAALALGKREARKLLDKQQQAGKLNAEQAQAIDAAIVATLGYEGFSGVDVLIEAVVENLRVKKTVLAEVEQQLGAHAILASNTSSLSIAELATSLQRPQNFVGMHFFNPVPLMPLVEVIRGPHTSDEAVATITAYAARMGKTAIVVKDCAGFLVNRILTAYIIEFLRLLDEGVDYEAIDHSMERFGWPMGPAYLQDVVGMDTSSHVIDFISAAYPQRMAMRFKSAVHAMAERQRYGQKCGVGFYEHMRDDRGRWQRKSSASAQTLVAATRGHAARQADAREIIGRLMLSMFLEASSCLEDGTASSPAEIDMALILGLGFPRHLGGIFHYADLYGLPQLLDDCERYGREPGATLLARAEAHACYF